MPYALKRTHGGWGVQNTQTRRWHSRDTLKGKAIRQLTLLNAIEHGYLARPGRRVPKGRKR